MSLVLVRNALDRLHHSDVDRASLTIETSDGPIVITLKSVTKGQGKISIDAPRECEIYRHNAVDTQGAENERINA